MRERQTFRRNTNRFRGRESWKRTNRTDRKNRKWFFLGRWSLTNDRATRLVLPWRTKAKKNDAKSYLLRHQGRSSLWTRDQEERRRLWPRGRKPGFARTFTCLDHRSGYNTFCQTTGRNSRPDKRYRPFFSPLKPLFKSGLCFFFFYLLILASFVEYSQNVPRYEYLAYQHDDDDYSSASNTVRATFLLVCI